MPWRTHQLIESYFARHTTTTKAKPHRLYYGSFATPSFSTPIDPTMSVPQAPPEEQTLIQAFKNFLNNNQQAAQEIPQNEQKASADRYLIAF